MRGLSGRKYVRTPKLGESVEDRRRNEEVEGEGESGVTWTYIPSVICPFVHSFHSESQLFDFSFPHVCLSRHILFYIR